MNQAYLSGYHVIMGFRGALGMFKKADMSINTVVVAALALIVLVVLTAIFVSRMNTTSDKAGKNDKVAFDKICLQPRDGYSQARCIGRTECGDLSGTVLNPAGTGIATEWMDCPKGDDAANPKVCCGIKNS